MVVLTLSVCAAECDRILYLPNTPHQCVKTKHELMVGLFSTPEPSLQCTECSFGKFDNVCCRQKFLYVYYASDAHKMHSQVRSALIPLSQVWLSSDINFMLLKRTHGCSFRVTTLSRLFRMPPLFQATIGDMQHYTNTILYPVIY